MLSKLVKTGICKQCRTTTKSLLLRNVINAQRFKKDRHLSSTKIAKRRYRNRKLVKTGICNQCRTTTKSLLLGNVISAKRFKKDKTFKFYKNHKKKTQKQKILHQRERESNAKLIPELFGAPVNLLDPLQKGQFQAAPAASDPPREKKPYVDHGRASSLV